MRAIRLPAFLFAVPLAISLVFVAERAVAAGLPMLRLNSGSRGAAMGNAMTAVPDVDAASANPAALSAQRQQSVVLGYTSWIQHVRHNHLAWNRRWGDLVLGGALQLTQADELERRTGPSAMPLGEFGVYTGTVTLTATRSWASRWRTGISLRAIRQSISTHSAVGGGVDLGILCTLADGLVAGAAVRHLGSMGELREESTQLPTAVRGGLAYRATEHLLISAEAQRARGWDTTWHLGGEFDPADGLCLRLGYQTADSRSVSAGLGLSRGAWTVDYAYVPFGHGLGEAHRLSIQLHQPGP